MSETDKKTAVDTATEAVSEPVKKKPAAAKKQTASEMAEAMSATGTWHSPAEETKPASKTAKHAKTPGTAKPAKVSQTEAVKPSEPDKPVKAKTTRPAAAAANSVEKTATVEVIDTGETTDAAPAEKPTPPPYRRRRKYRFLAPLGIVVNILAIVGVIAIVVGGIGLIRKATDMSGRSEEFYYYLEPVMYYSPAAFDNIAETEQDAFLSAAAYRLSLQEQVRMLRERDENCSYAVDEQGRIAVPVAEVEAAYKALFGPDAPLTHRTLSTEELLYSEADSCYYVPFESLSAANVPVIDAIRRHGKFIDVRIGFVVSNDIPYDEHGNLMDPTPEMATYFQTYTLVEQEDGSYYISALKDE